MAVGRVLLPPSPPSLRLQGFLIIFFFNLLGTEDGGGGTVRPPCRGGRGHGAVPRGRQGARRGEPPNTGTGSPPPGGAQLHSQHPLVVAGGGSEPAGKGTALPGDGGTGGVRGREEEEDEKGGGGRRPPPAGAPESGRGGEGDPHQMKSVQWLQKVGCLKKRAVNLWFFTSCTFFCRRAPLRAKRTGPSSPSGPGAAGGSAMLGAGWGLRAVGWGLREAALGSAGSGPARALQLGPGLAPLGTAGCSWRQAPTHARRGPAPSST